MKYYQLLQKMKANHNSVSIVDYDNLYDKITNNWGYNISKFINKDDIINKTKSKEIYYNPKLSTNPLPYFSTLMKHMILNEVNKKHERISKINKRIKKLKRLGI